MAKKFLKPFYWTILVNKLTISQTWELVMVLKQGLEGQNFCSLSLSTAFLKETFICETMCIVSYLVLWIIS